MSLKPPGPGAVSRLRRCASARLAVLWLVLAGACALPLAARGQLYVGNIVSGSVSIYDPATGLPITPAFINARGALSMAILGDRMFVTHYTVGAVGAYDLATGAVIDAAFIPNLPSATSFSLLTSGDNLYVGSGLGVGVYSATTGLAVNAALIPASRSFYPTGMVFAPGGLLVGNLGTRTVGLYDAATGSVINANFLSGIGAGVHYGMVVSGNNCYVADYMSGTVSVFDATTGGLINASFVSQGRQGIYSMQVADGLLYVANGDEGTLSTYDVVTGALVNANLYGTAVRGAFTLLFAGDSHPQISAQNSGLAFGNAMGQSVLGSVQGMLGDINGHLFSLRAGGGDDEDDNDDNSGLTASLDEGVILGEGDGPEGKAPRRVAPAPASTEWEVFTTVNFANVRLGAIGSQPGVDSYTWAPGVGVEKRVAPGLTLGFAANLLESHQTYSNGLGTLEMEGFGLSTYASYARRDYWIDLLYSFGRFDLDSERNPGFAFPVARGETTAYTNAVQLNGGWKFHVPAWRLTHGPFAGVDYLNVKVQDYNELGGGAAALSYASRSIDSLITRVGYSVSREIDTRFAKITPQVRVSYERQNISNNNGTSVNLINQPFAASSNAQSPGQDYLVAGAGVNFQFTPTLSLMLTYQGQFFRENLQAHYAGVRLGWQF